MLISMGRTFRSPSVMSRCEPSYWSSLDLRTDPNTHVPVRAVRRAVWELGALTTEPSGHESNSRHVADKQRHRPPPVLPFSKLIKKFSGYFDPDFFFKIMKIDNFRGELTDTSA